MDEQSTTDAAARLLNRLRDFSQDLADDERELFAVIVGPGMQELTKGNDEEVEGFGMDTVRWEPGSLRDKLSQAVENSEWQVIDGS